MHIIIHKNFLSVILGAIAVLSMATPLTATASSSDGKKSGISSSSAVAAEMMGSTDEPASSQDRSKHRPGPAWKTIGGTVTHIKGEVYTVEDYDGNQVHLYVSRETKRLRGQKKVGDRVRAEITRDGFANSIQ